MSKITGLGMQVEIDDSAGAPQDISNDINDITVNTSRGSQDVTGLDKEALERLLLLGDASVTIKGTFNAALSHTVLNDFGAILAGQVGRTVTLTYPGTVILEMEMVFENYDVARAANGALTWTATGKLSDGTVPTWS
jgi:hypothetical protein